MPPQTRIRVPNAFLHLIHKRARLLAPAMALLAAAACFLAPLAYAHFRLCEQAGYTVLLRQQPFPLIFGVQYIMLIIR